MENGGVRDAARYDFCEFLASSPYGEDRGEKPGGGGYGKPENHEPMRKGGRKSGESRS